MKDDRVYLKHIRDCLVRIKQYIQGGREEFLESTLVQDAVLRNLHTLTESTQRLSADLKAAFPNVAWKGMAGFRNVLVHGYLEVNLHTVWKIIQSDLPTLEADLGKMLRRRKRAAPLAAPKSAAGRRRKKEKKKQ